VYDAVASVYLPVAIAVLAIVVGLLVLVAVRDRASRGHEVSGRNTSTWLERGYAVFLVIVAGLLAWRALAGTEEQARATGKPMVTIGVVASKWTWRFAYPGGVVQQSPGPRGIPTLVVPSGRPVRFRLTSADVEHAFWIPEARFKRDAVPGFPNVWTMSFDQNRRYTTARCSEFCGEFHTEMRLRVDVRPPAAFRRWLTARQGAS
jgi:cytochrome c oxidase subunit 2